VRRAATDRESAAARRQEEVVRSVAFLILLSTGCATSECPSGWVLQSDPSPNYCTPSDPSSIASRIGTGIYGWVAQLSSEGCDECTVQPIYTPANVRVWQPTDLVANKWCPYVVANNALPAAQAVTQKSLFEMTLPPGDYQITAENPLGTGCPFDHPITVPNGIIELEIRFLR
jgi:hypothetical protein